MAEGVSDQTDRQEMHAGNSSLAGEKNGEGGETEDFKRYTNKPL